MNEDDRSLNSCGGEGGGGLRGGSGGGIENAPGVGCWEINQQSASSKQIRPS